MSGARRGLGRGLGALIPEQPPTDGPAKERPHDVFFTSSTPEKASGATASAQEGLVPVPGATFAHIDPQEVTPNPRQPRAVFDEEALAELVGSIKEIGVLQPIVVRRKSEGGYEPHHG
ncbi:ParB N-terminal domain-containing protein [Demequina litorisediminis]|uniref:ParB-like N-terminal domain-containing protein n=1 Tax=Demequina litorisediminis TaxID=1849022 RepID=A0ABQ6IF35_9MICO|nr:hypothetical protein GCM10025876_19660 [Demequina litorisediminis]